jgi:hypothetical protein
MLLKDFPENLCLEREAGEHCSPASLSRVDCSKAGFHLPLRAATQIEPL